MYQHHQDSIKNMIAHYSQNPEITALFLVGSVVTGTERSDSDLDGVAVVSKEYYEVKKNKSSECESIFGKCTYDGGYFDVHFLTKQHMEDLAISGSEPNRNRFTNARVLFCNEPDLPKLAAKIPIFQKKETASKQLKFYCTFKQYYTYFWQKCNPEGFTKHHIANGMVYSMYRLILIENEILFPSMRKLEFTVSNAPNKPDSIVKKCRHFLSTLEDKDACSLIENYEEWTSYNFPKEFQFIANKFSDPWEWQ